MKTSAKKSTVGIHVASFLIFAGIACSSPFLSTHMRDVGLTFFECILINISASIFSTLLPLLTTFIAERRGRYKLSLTVSLIVSGVAYTSFLTIPRTIRIPRQPLVDFDCSPAVNLEKCSNWATCSDAASTWAESTFRLSHCQYKCSSPRPHNSSYPLHMCFHSAEHNNNLCLVYDPDGQESSILEFQSSLSLWHFTEYRNISASEFLATDSRNIPFSDVCSFRPALSSLIVNRKSHDSLFCRPLPEGCTVKCLLSIQPQKAQLESSLCHEIVGNPQFTFWLYLGLRSLADASLMCVLCLLEAVTVHSINDYRGAYGRSRAWYSFAFILCPPSIGALVDYYTRVAGRPDYSPAFFVFAGFILISFAVVLTLHLQFGTMGRYIVSPSRHPSEEPKFWSLGLWITIFVASILGIFWGFSESYTPWFYMDLGFNYLMLGFTHSITFLCTLPFLIVAKILIHNIGEANLLSTAFAFHALRYAGISFISDPWWTLPFEAMKSFTLGIMWIALVAQGQSLVSKDFRAITQGVLVISHFGVGRIIGITAGGFLAEYFGLRIVFRVMSVASLVSAIIYFGMHHLCLKPRNRKKMETRRNAQRLSVNGSCLQLEERRPVNGRSLNRQLMEDFERDSD